MRLRQNARSSWQHRREPPHALILLNVILSLAAFATAGEKQSGQSFGWRGDGSGRFSEAAPPIEWDGESGKNILWKTKVGVSKFSSPTFVNGKIFVVAEPAHLICLDASDGKILWDKSNGFDALPDKTEEKPARGEQGNTTPTPVSDGQFVYASFGSGIVACYDLQGQRQWIRYIDAPPGLDFGRSASPTLIGEKLLVSVHHLFALDVKTGKTLWSNTNLTERYGTPLTTRIGGVELVMAPSGQIVRASDGAVLSTTTELQYASPVVCDSVAYFISTISSAVALSKAGSDVATKKVWKTEFEGTYFASPVCANGLLYTASNEGNFIIIDAADGKTLSTKVLQIGSAAGRPDLPSANIYPNLTQAGTYLFLSNDVGDTLVLGLGKEYQEIKHNNLGEGFSGSPVFAGTRMYVRTKDRLYCIGGK